MRTLIRDAGLIKLVEVVVADENAGISPARYDIEVEGEGVLHSFAERQEAEGYLQMLLGDDDQANAYQLDWG